MLGGLFYFFAHEHYKGREWLIRNSFKNNWSYNKRVAYQKNLVVPYSMLATLFIVMGIVEDMAIMSVRHFVYLYFALAFVVFMYTAYRVWPFFRN